jgi:hypothetical protein
MNMNNVVLNELMDKKILEVNFKIGDDDLIIKTECGNTFRFYHYQDCCEHVYLQNIIGDDSFTWTFFRLASEKGVVVFRFLGTSNGYYSEGITISMDNKISF